MKKLQKLQKGDSVAILSPSFAAPGRWPEVYALGLDRVKNVFGLNPIEFPTTAMLNATSEERAKDLIDAFANPEIKAVISSIGGNDQVTYTHTLSPEPFVQNPKPFFGFSDNSHFENFLWLNGVPSFYGGSLFTQFAMQKEMDDFTVNYLNKALFESGTFELSSSDIYNDIGYSWSDLSLLDKKRAYEENDGWFWEGKQTVSGVTWGGCLESIDEMLRHGVPIPSLSQFENIVLLLETSEEIPSSDYVFRVLRALGARGILGRVRGLLVGRPKAWEFDKLADTATKKLYRVEQRATISKIFRQFNTDATIVQNMDFGHTDPQIPIPYGAMVNINVENKKIHIEF